MLRVKNRSRWLLCVLLLMAPAMAHAHIGSPDVVAQVDAGPYPLLISVEPAGVVPGVAQVQVQSNSADITGISIAPTPLTGEASQHPPVADKLQKQSGGIAFYAGSVWLMSDGAWRLHVTVEGARGVGEVSIPVPSVATGTLTMPVWLMGVLAAVGALLIFGLAAMVGAARRESLLAPGTAPDADHVRQGRLGIALTLLLLIGVVVLGGWWWKTIATDYRKNLYKPMTMSAVMEGPDKMHLRLQLPEGDKVSEKLNQYALNTISRRQLDDLLPDHGHIMHLYMVREPQMDVVLHLHPVQVGAGDFVQMLPTMPSGEYLLYADIVHEDGFAETVTSEIGVTLDPNAPRLSGDDSLGVVAPLNDTDWTARSETMPDGYVIAFDRPPLIQRQQPVLLHFELLDAKGKPAPDAVDYMGMRGHAAILKVDGTVFAHIHPFGSASMASLMMANPQKDMPGMKMDGMNMEGMGSMLTVERPANVAVFPYAFPTAGNYRILVQMKHGQTIETAAFDVGVE